MIAPDGGMVRVRRGRGGPVARLPRGTNVKKIGNCR
jgi:hypothetical protein